MRAAVLEQWDWRDEITQQVVNTDIDGLLTAALLHEAKGWPVVGFYDTESLWLASTASVPLSLPETLWVDADMCFPGARCLSQHVTTAQPGDATTVVAFRHTINPNLVVGCHGGSFSVYKDKYPFGTFQWAAWLAGRPTPPRLDDHLLQGLAWMPDGGFQSVMHPAWRRNCLDWATRTLPGSILAPLAQHDPRAAAGLVSAAAKALKGPQPLPNTWRNDQYVMSTNVGGFTVHADVTTAEGLRDVQAVLDRITTAYGWRRLVLPTFDRRYQGTWRGSAGAPPHEWVREANAGRIVSFAVTGRNKYCWTEAECSRDVPALSSALG